MTDIQISIAFKVHNIIEMPEFGEICAKTEKFISDTVQKAMEE